MKFIADFHVHSKYSRATSKHLDLENLYIAAQLKGITVVGTGDFTHPAWWQEITTKLTPAEEGLFVLNPDIARHCDQRVPSACRRPVRFMLTTEISNIYKKNGVTRKNHNLVFLPDRTTAEHFRYQLDKIGNIKSDGRPILGLDARDLLEIVLETTAQGYLIPAHIWTPWFSLLGSKSGFDSLEECFGDLADHIFALETGLSSDPPMNWRVSNLDRYTLVSNSDAHSPSKLGREANLFDTELSYPAIREALETSDRERFLGTFEFFPEEGKYHLDGHRKCGFRSLPEETRFHQGICPVCHKPLTLGVLYRVEALADRSRSIRPPKAAPYYNLIPLESILAEIFQTGPQTKRVATAYQQLIERFGGEFEILRNVPPVELDSSGVPLLSDAIARMRNDHIHFEPGFDGEFGRVTIFDAAERRTLSGQKSIFGVSDAVVQKDPPPVRPSKADNVLVKSAEPPSEVTMESVCQFELNAEQQSVVDHSGGPMIVVAGPGTGKTQTITHRMGVLIANGRATANGILAVTFTNKAAREMARRLRTILGPDAELPLATTFHGLCWRLLRTLTQARPKTIVDDAARREVLADTIDRLKHAGTDSGMSVEQLLEIIISAKQQLIGPRDDLSAVAPAKEMVSIRQVYQNYQEALRCQNACDFEDLIAECVRSLESDPLWCTQLQQQYAYIFVDEFQDINYGQYCLIRLLAPAHANVCAIGDPDQAIYGFRGSDVAYFNQFIADYPNTRVIHLTRNYRSTETILKSAFQVIDTYQLQLNGVDIQRTYSHRDGFRTVSIMKSASAKAEAVAIGRVIEQMVGGTGFHAVDFEKVEHADATGSFSDVAVLFRTAEQGRQIEQVLTQAGLPCRFISRKQWLQHAGVAAVWSLMRVMNGNAGFTDLDPISSILEASVSKQTIARFKSWAYDKQLSLAQALNTVARVPLPGLSTTAQHGLLAWVRQIEDLKEATHAMSVAGTAAYLIEHTRLAALRDAAELNDFLEMSTPFGSDCNAFLANMALNKDTDFHRSDAEKIALMTMHAAKGLEFATVFIAGCEDGLIPYRIPGKAITDLDEERRLFYVAMTRAKERLFLSWAAKRTLYGQTGNRRVSPFVASIEHRLKANAAPWNQGRPQQRQLSLF
jgi:DNA helicase-2/ATP-dependent DNA helicase PcrA